MDLSFYRNRKVLITGHTGFKGSWMCELLLCLGADVTGYALDPPTDPSLFEILNLKERVNSVKGDVRDLDHMMKTFDAVQPEVVIHMAAQPIVRTSYQEPVYTYDVNVMGTVNVLECVRLHPCVKSFVNVTTDKVYLNREWQWGYRENEELNGFDPYSNSKSCSELVTGSYRNSFFRDRDTAITTMRAGNVIGGGDFAKDRIIPDAVRAAEKKEPLVIRNPYSTRPYQHVLEPVTAYLMVAARQYADKKYEGSYNVGPDDKDCRTTGELADLFCEKWNKKTGGDLLWENKSDGGPHEANFLKLDCSLLKSSFGWKPVWGVEDAVDEIVEWTDLYFRNEDMRNYMDEVISAFISH